MQHFKSVFDVNFNPLFAPRHAPGYFNQCQQLSCEDSSILVLVLAFASRQLDQYHLRLLQRAMEGLNLSSYQMPSRRRVLFSVIAATCQEAGFTSADNYVLDILLELFQSFLCELSLGAKGFCEHSGRSDPLPGDVLMALIEMGITVESLSAFAFRPNRITVPLPPQQPKQVTPKILQTGKKKQLLKYIPDHFPPFPDSHSYISTPTAKQPITNYETLREKSSVQKRDVERALTRFMARTFTSSYTYSLFPDDQLSHLFPLIGIKVENVTYLSAFMSKDLVVDNASNQFNSLLDKSSQDDSRLNELTDSTKEADDSFVNEVDMSDNPYVRPPKIVNF